MADELQNKKVGQITNEWSEMWTDLLWYKEDKYNKES